MIPLGQILGLTRIVPIIITIECTFCEQMIRQHFMQIAQQKMESTKLVSVSIYFAKESFDLRKNHKQYECEKSDWESS